MRVLRAAPVVTDHLGGAFPVAFARPAAAGRVPRPTASQWPSGPAPRRPPPAPPPSVPSPPAACLPPAPRAASAFRVAPDPGPAGDLPPDRPAVGPAIAVDHRSVP